MIESGWTSRLCVIIGLCCVVQAAASTASYAQEFLPMDPLDPIGPRDQATCDALAQAWDNLASDIEARHERCLDAHRTNREQQQPGAGFGPGSRCSYPGCQDLHTRKYEVSTRKGPSVDACRTTVQRYQDDERQRKEAAERAERDREARERLAKQEQQRRDAEARQRKADADREESAGKARERERREAEKRRLDSAAKASEREREALARRTDTRNQKMQELKDREDGVNDAFDRAVEERTAKARDALFQEVARNTGTENNVFVVPPAPTGAGADDFDLSVASGTGETPPPSSLDRLRDVISPLAAQGKDLVSDRLRRSIQEEGAEIRNTILSGAFGDADVAETATDMAKRFFDDSYKDPIHEMVGAAFDRATGGQEATDDIARVLGDHLRNGQGLLRGDGFVGAMRDIAIKTAVEKLTGDIRGTFVEQVSARIKEEYASLSEPLLGTRDNVTDPVQDTALLRLPSLISKLGSPQAAAKALYDYGMNMVNAMNEMFDRLLKSDFYGTAPPDFDADR